ncbi:MAG: hypothetical protein M1837_003393 [Sclerophora amabilis]|nr:MAG: hypothetical protein M1837_003393 [Sclerophora amabilis]
MESESDRSSLASSSGDTVSSSGSRVRRLQHRGQDEEGDDGGEVVRQVKSGERDEQGDDRGEAVRQAKNREQDEQGDDRGEAVRQAQNREQDEQGEGETGEIRGPTATESFWVDPSQREEGAQVFPGGHPRFETWLEFLNAGGDNGQSRIVDTLGEEINEGAAAFGGGQDDRGSSPGGEEAAGWGGGVSTRQRAGLYPHRNATESVIDEPELAGQNVIDLRSPPGNQTETLPRPPPPPSAGVIGDSASPGIVLPRWQPDAEVSRCPICGKQFTFWFRKHHCRKCGRVVCTLCSPHRITIPRQFIVHPPSPPNSSPSATRRPSHVGDLVGDDGEMFNSAYYDQPNAMSLRAANPGSVDFALGGGAEVRICNPCVPDPNTAPPPQLGHPSKFPRAAGDPSIHHHHQGHSVSPARTFSDMDLTGSQEHARTSARHPWEADYQPRRARDHVALSAQDSFMGLGERGVLPMRDPNDRTPITGHRRRGVTFADHALPSTPPPPPPYPRDPHHPHQRAHHDSTRPPRSTSAFASSSFSNPSPSSSAPSAGSHHFSSSSSRPPSHYRHRPSPSLGSNVFPGGQGSRLPSMLDVRDEPHPQLPGPRRSHLREEDYCPVCHAALPPKRSNGDESAREEHIQNCVSEHFLGSGSGTGTPQDGGPTGNITDRPLPPPPPGTSSTSPLTGEGIHTTTISTSTPPPPAPLARPRRLTGAGNRMITYLATEKDCMVNGGGDYGGHADETQKEAECVICFEEFEVGVEMARLECLCKFHRQCIRTWWERKGGGCPVHQDGS